MSQLSGDIIRELKQPGFYGDGNGLYLKIDNKGSKRWVQRIVIQGKRRDLGLGSAHLVTLNDARMLALTNRQTARTGGDPMRKPTKPRKPKGQGPNPVDYAKAGTEHAHQVALFMWAALPETKLLYPELQRMFAIPNGGERNKIVAGRLKAEGVKAGMLDMMLPFPRMGYAGLFLELKRPKSEAKGRKGVEREEQSEWLVYLRSVGYGAATCYGWEEARDMLISYLTYGSNQ